MDKEKIEKIIANKLNKYRFELPKDEYDLVAKELAETIVKNCSIPYVVGQSEQLFCPHCEGTDIQKNFYTDTYGCNSCGHSWAK